MNYKEMFRRIIYILKDNRASAELKAFGIDDEKIDNFLRHASNLYSVQLGMLNNLFKTNEIPENQYRKVKSFLKNKYKIKN